MKSGRRDRRSGVAYLFLIPAGLIYLAVVVIPIVCSGWMSLHELGPGMSRFVGLANFRELLQDEIFRQSLIHNLVLVVLSLVIQLPVALGLAVLLSSGLRGRAVFRTGFFMPMMLSTVVIGLLTRELFRADVGVVNTGLRAAFGVEGPEWLGGSLALLTVIIAISWRYVGFHMMLFVAGIDGIPVELYEAARIDGAGSWACFRHVTLPGLRGVIAISALLSVVGSLKYFDLVWVVTEGGPGHASELMTTYMYKQAFFADRLGYASAIAVTALVISLIAATVYMLTLRKQEAST